MTNKILGIVYFIIYVAVMVYIFYLLPLWCGLVIVFRPEIRSYIHSLVLVDEQEVEQKVICRKSPFRYYADRRFGYKRAK